MATEWVLTKEQIAVFHNGGFTEFEIGQINEDLRLRPQTIDPTNEAWQRAFRERLSYIRAKTKQGYSLKRIQAKIIAYLIGKKGEHSPWDFLRDAYPIRGGKRSDFNKRVEARAKIKEHFGRY